MQPRTKEFQTFRLFATLGLLTVIAVLLFRVVLFGPHLGDKSRTTANSAENSSPPEITVEASINK